MAQNLKINILAKDKTKAALNGVRGRLAGLKNAVFSLKGAFVGLGAPYWNSMHVGSYLE